MIIWSNLQSPSEMVILMDACGAQDTDADRWKQILSHKDHFALRRS